MKNILYISPFLFLSCLSLSLLKNLSLIGALSQTLCIHTYAYFVFLGKVGAMCVYI